MVGVGICGAAGGAADLYDCGEISQPTPNLGGSEGEGRKEGGKEARKEGRK